MPALPVSMRVPTELPQESKKRDHVPEEYLQGTMNWLLEEDELPVEYKSRWEDDTKSRRNKGWGPEEKSFTS